MSLAVKKFGPAHFLNRELSWLEFNQRVLDEALDAATPLLERIKFFSIVSSNLDEFFEVRVAGLKQQIESDVVERSADGLTATENLLAVTERVRQMVEQQYTCWREKLVPALAENEIHFLHFKDLAPPDLAWIENYYRAEVRPVLTPLGIDPAHPFPQLLNKSLNIIVQLEIRQNGDTRRRLAIVQVPRVLPRLVQMPRTDSRLDYIFMGNLIGHYLSDLFPGTKIIGYWHFRVTRNSELYIDEEDAANLLKAVENELHNRRKGDAVRLEVEKDCPPEIRAQLLENLRLEEEDLYIIDGPLNPTRLMTIYAGDHSPELRDPPFVAPVTAALKGENDLFAAIRQRDILLHHPYENFDSVVNFLEQAATDPNVLAIKQTLYRTGGDPRIVGALMAAVRNGKQVTAVVELKARFDEANNILWAQKLEEAGVHVLYGLVGYKIHGKMCLVVRKDDDAIRRYVHLSTGNYNPTTSRFYTDVGLMTCHRDFGEDVTNLFNLLTGICQFQGTRKLLVAPFEWHARLLQLIQRESKNASQGLPARIIAKMNALVDREIIEALYRASQAGAKIDLIVRGICCLRPQVKGLSENISVRSIVDRFLEHSRIFYFENALQPEILMGSADWMPRNFFRRIEVIFPIEDGNLRDRIRSEILEIPLRDNTKARFLNADGTYSRPGLKRGQPARRSQREFIALAEGEEKTTRNLRKGHFKFPQVKLATKPSPRPR
ncbi:MAG: polyphosphate kinase 1 [Verrucomicrobiota bacterium]|nr:polyphosphate kinase 1 [Verrucomicrobiota bacterium]